MIDPATACGSPGTFAPRYQELPRKISAPHPEESLFQTTLHSDLNGDSASAKYFS
jgi:hypothetical protein